MADGAYPPSPLTTPTPPASQPIATTGYIQPARPVTPTPDVIPPGTYKPSPLTPLDYTAHLETGDRNIPQQIHDINSAQGHPAQGNWQFIVPTWQRQAPKAGVDLRQYPTPMSAPRDVQARVAAVTPGTEFGPRTQAGLKARFPGIDLTKPLGYYGGTAGGSIASSAGGAAAAPPPSGAAPSPNFGQALQSGNVGAMLGALNTPNAQGQSPLQQAGQTMQQGYGGGGTSSAGRLGGTQIPQQAPNPMAMMHTSYGLAGPSQQLFAQTMEQAQKPLSWNSAPYGSAAGYQPQPAIPGITLNS